jgi:hypothetical protein
VKSGRKQSNQLQYVFVLVSVVAYSSNLKLDAVYIHLKHLLTLNRLQGVMYQNVELFVITTIRISYHTNLKMANRDFSH